jgi:mono/diheme cytochrome c family protein
MNLFPAVGVATFGAISVLVLMAADDTQKTTASRPSPAEGRAMFIAYCASCHGTSGKGDGPAAAALKTPPPDLTMLSAHNDGKFPERHVYSAIRGDPNVPAHGSAEMPVWGVVFAKMSRGSSGEALLRLSNLVTYIRSIQAK